MPVSQTVATTILVEFDDLGEKKSLGWVQEVEVPAAAKKIVTVALYDGTQLVFSSKQEMVRYFSKPAVVKNISQYKPVQKMDKVEAV